MLLWHYCGAVLTGCVLGRCDYVKLTHGSGSCEKKHSLFSRFGVCCKTLDSMYGFVTVQLIL